jgi:hypothetical protein
VLEGILSGFGNAVNSAINLPYQQYQGPRVANLSPLQNQAIGNYSGLISDPSWQQAQNTYSDAQNGSMNPYMQQVGQTVIADTTNAFNHATAGTRSAYNTPGNFGSARQGIAQDTNETNLARGLSQGLGGVYSNAYDNMQNRRIQGANGSQQLAGTYGNALNNSIQAGNTSRNFDQNVIDALYGDWQSANNYPWQQIERGANVFGQLQGGAPRQTTTTGPGSDRVSQGLGLWALGNNLGGSSGSKA